MRLEKMLQNLERGIRVEAARAEARQRYGLTEEDQARLEDIARRVVVSSRCGFGGKVILSEVERELIERLKVHTTGREREALAKLLGV